MTWRCRHRLLRTGIMASYIPVIVEDGRAALVPPGAEQDLAVEYLKQHIFGELSLGLPVAGSVSHVGQTVAPSLGPATHGRGGQGSVGLGIGFQFSPRGLHLHG